MSNSEISWQSAYFGLVGIALNTMAQPAGRVCGFSAASSFFIRASPVLCAMDTLQTVMQLTLYSWRSQSLCEGIAHVINELYEDETVETGGEDPLTTLRKTRATRWTVFGLTGITQIIKLLACSGIPWTNLCVISYTVSWLAVEVQAICATHKRIKAFRLRSLPPGWSLHQEWKRITFAKWLGSFGVLAQIILAMIAMTYAGAFLFLDNQSETGFSKSGKIFAKIMWAPTLGLLYSWMSAMIVFLPLSILASCLTTGESVNKLLVLCGFVGGIIGQVRYWKDELTFFDKRAMLFFGFLGHCYICMVLFNTLVGLEYLSLATLSRFTFFLTSCFGALSFYATLYDSTGTYRPDWVSLLG